MHKQVSYILLGVQALSFLFLVFSGPLLPYDPMLIFTQVLALGVILWACYVLWIVRSLSAFPEPLTGSKLVTTGPFEYIRHPIYSGLLLLVLISIINYISLFRFAVFIVFIIDLLFKVHLEEEYLEKRFEEYKGYQHRTKKLIPFLD